MNIYVNCTIHYSKKEQLSIANCKCQYESETSVRLDLVSQEDHSSSLIMTIKRLGIISVDARFAIMRKRVVVGKV